MGFDLPTGLLPHPQKLPLQDALSLYLLVFLLLPQQHVLLAHTWASLITSHWLALLAHIAAAAAECPLISPLCHSFSRNRLMGRDAFSDMLALYSAKCRGRSSSGGLLLAPSADDGPAGTSGSSARSSRPRSASDVVAGASALPSGPVVRQCEAGDFVTVKSVIRWGPHLRYRRKETAEARAYGHSIFLWAQCKGMDAAMRGGYRVYQSNMMRPLRAGPKKPRGGCPTDHPREPKGLYKFRE